MSALRVCSDDTASPDAIPFGKLALRGADSAALLKEPPEPRTPTSRTAPARAPQNIRPGRGRLLDLTVSSIPRNQASFARGYFIAAGKCSCPRPTLARPWRQPRNTRAMPIKPSRISTREYGLSCGNPRGARSMSAPHRFPPGFVGEVRHQTRQRLVPLIAHHVKLEKAGRDWKGCCPFHGEKTPSFHVYGDGHYHCFGCRAHGDAIEWLVRGEGLTFNDAVLQLAGDAGIKAPDTRQQETPAERAVREARVAHEQAEQQRIRDAAIAAELAEELDKARAIIAETVDWDGTPAWRNWHAVRAIPEAAADRSAVLRWHPARRALIAIATDAAGVPTSGQMIMVRSDGTNVARRSGKKTKLTIGRPTATNAVVRLPGDASKPLVIAEGPENADSVAAPSGCEAWASLGPIPRIEPPGGRDVIVLSDGDDPDKPAAIDLEAWVAKWRALGRRIVIARPRPEWTGHKYDFNDLLQEQGPGAVLDRIAVARVELREQHIADLAAQKFTLADPPFALPTATADEVKTATFHAVHTFFMQRGIQPPARIVVPGQTGSGKTEAVGQLLPHIIAADKAERLLPGSREGAPYRAVIMVPAHKLGRQIAKRYEALGLSVAILEGRGDPWRPEKPSRPYLCRNLEAVGLALLAHQDVSSAVCGKANGSRCPFFEGCGYLAQFNRAHDADVLIVAHEFLFERLPKSVLHDVAYVIIEEDFIPTGDAIAELPVDVFRSHSISSAPALDRHGEADEEKTADLLRYSAMIAAMLDAEPDGYLADDALDRHHVTQSDARYLRYLHWNRRRDAQMHPGMSLAERREAQHHAVINQQLPRIAAMMLMLENGEASRIRLTTDNKGRRSIVTHGRRTSPGGSPTSRC